MMFPLGLALSLACAIPAPDHRAEPAAQFSCNFESPKDLEGWTLDATGQAKRRMPAPKIASHEGASVLSLLESWAGSTAAAACPAPAATLTREVSIAFTFTMNTGTEGMGFAWLDMSRHGNNPTIPPALSDAEIPTPGANPFITQAAWGWEVPNFLQGFGIGIDASNPPNRDPFGGSGNIYDRPQHEISLHWDGREIIKRTTPAEFRDDKPHRLSCTIAFETGGARINLKLDGSEVFTNQFIPGMTAFIGRPVWGARNDATAGDVTIDDVAIELREPIEAPKPPVRVAVLSRVLNDAAHGENIAQVDLPTVTSGVGRVIATLRLDKPETKFDPWDRSGHIFIERTGTDQPERIELMRYMTPYHRGWEWLMDVTDLLPRLTGATRFIQQCGTQGEGWVTSLTLDFYPGPTTDGLHPREVRSLWVGSPEIGNPDKPVTGFYTPVSMELPDWAAAAKVRMTVTGHGMNPNSNNAAEFMPIGRTLTINGTEHKNRLWKDDNYLNPCRPQGGTWKYDRAGWAPGDVVRPWAVLTPLAAANGSEARPLTINYTLDPFENTNRGKTWAPFHLTHTQLILYERR